MTQATPDIRLASTDRSIGHELGRDHAHHGLTPAPCLLASSAALRQGWEAGRAAFGERTLPATRHVQAWLQLRLTAWQQGRAFEGIQVTPNHLRQIDVDWCPVLRTRLTRGTGFPSDAEFARLRDDAGYAAGNLAVISSRANASKVRGGFDKALSLMRLAESLPVGATDGLGGLPSHDQLGGLDAAQWGRIAVLCSFVTALPHSQAARLPLLLLPPNRMRLFNPVQALQALITRQFGHDGWSARIARVEALLPQGSVRSDFQVFVHALLPRVLERGRPCDAQSLRWAVEDAWRDPLALRCWSRFAGRLCEGQAEQLAQQVSLLTPGAPRVQLFTWGEATEGWALEQHGGRAEPVEACAPSLGGFAWAARQPAAKPARRLPVKIAFGC